MIRRWPVVHVFDWIFTIAHLLSKNYYGQVETCWMTNNEEQLTYLNVSLLKAVLMDLKISLGHFLSCQFQREAITLGLVFGKQKWSKMPSIHT